MNPMLSIVTRPLFLLAAVVAVSPVQRCQAALSRQFEHTYPISANGVLEFRGINGTVAISGWDEPAVEVHATLRARNEENLDTMAVQVQAASDHVVIWNDQPGGLMQHASETVDYVIRVPFGCRLKDVQVVRSSLSIAGVRGPMHVKVVSGDMSVRDIANDCDLEVVHGSLDAVVAQIAPSHRFRAKTTTGGCTVALPEDSSAVISANTTFGSIRNDLNRSGPQKDAGQLGGTPASGSVVIESVLGNIVVRKTARR